MLQGPRGGRRVDWTCAVQILLHLRDLRLQRRLLRRHLLILLHDPLRIAAATAALSLCEDGPGTAITAVDRTQTKRGRLMARS